MATMAMPAKKSRIDIRMTSEQKRQIEEAAEVNGMNLSQWVLDRLLASARRDIMEARSVALEGQAFDEFARLLDEPQDPAFVELLGRRPAWQE